MFPGSRVAGARIATRPARAPTQHSWSTGRSSDDKTNLISVRASDGKIRWQFNSPGAIKASPSYHDGRVYVADYQAAMFSVDADSGKLPWRTNTSKVRPFGDGGFYSSPAVAFGHVYAAPPR